jgi:excisionase family DNA binding protein
MSTINDLRPMDSTEAGAFLGVHPKTINRLARLGQIPAFRIGKLWRYRISDLTEWADSKVESICQPERVMET